MKIAIIGGGNIGTQIAARCASQGHCVQIYTSKPECFTRILQEVDENGEVRCEGVIAGASNNFKQAIAGAEYIFVTTPSFCMHELAKQILPFVQKGMNIGLIPGSGGGEWAFKECVGKGADIFGLQRVPSVARLVEYGKKVQTLGYRDEIFVATIGARCEKICTFLSKLFAMPCHALPNYLCVSLVPSNPILHPARLKTLFNDYHPGIFYSFPSLFYEEWDNSASHLLLALDDEVQQICHRLDKFDLTNVKSLRFHYNAEDYTTLTKKIQSIKSLKKIYTPMIKIDKGYIPDLNSRYFIADFNYGLSIFIQIAKFLGIDTKNINSTFLWYKSLDNSKEYFKFYRYGVSNTTDFCNYYLKKY